MFFGLFCLMWESVPSGDLVLSFAAGGTFLAAANREMPRYGSRKFQGYGMAFGLCRCRRVLEGRLREPRLRAGIGWAGRATLDLSLGVPKEAARPAKARYCHWLRRCGGPSSGACSHLRPSACSGRARSGRGWVHTPGRVADGCAVGGYRRWTPGISRMIPRLGVRR